MPVVGLKGHTHAVVVVGTTVVGQEVHRVVRHDIFRVFAHKVYMGRRRECLNGRAIKKGEGTFHGGPQRLDGAPGLFHREGES
jgi:hypothetical protein